MKIIITTAFKPTMESKLAIQNGGQVAISIRGEEEKPKPATPQLFGYYLFLCVFFLIPAAFFDSKLQTFKQHPGGVFIIITFVTISVTILATAILVVTSCYLKSYMRIVHYTVLKAVGSLSAILALFFFEVALFVPDNPSKTVYTLIAVISVGIVVGCCFYWKYAFSQQPTHFNELDSTWMLLILVPIPLEVVLLPFIRDLYWIVDVVCFVQSSILCVVIIKMLLRIHNIMRMGTSPTTVSQEQDSTSNHH